MVFLTWPSGCPLRNQPASGTMLFTTPNRFPIIRHQIFIFPRIRRARLHRLLFWNMSPISLRTPFKQYFSWLFATTHQRSSAWSLYQQHGAGSILRGSQQHSCFGEYFIAICCFLNPYCSLLHTARLIWRLSAFTYITNYPQTVIPDLAPTRLRLEVLSFPTGRRVPYQDFIAR